MVGSLLCQPGHQLLMLKSKCILLLVGIEDFSICKEIDWSRMCPGCPTDMVCDWINEDFEAWLASYHPNNRTQNISTANRPSMKGKLKRRAELSRVQSLIRRNKGRCGQDVLNGCWSAARARPTLADQERFWRGVFGRVKIGYTQT